jgi:hypothetical protein
MCSFLLPPSACSHADISCEAFFAFHQNLVPCRSSFLAEHIEDYHRVGSNVVDDPPSLILVINPQFLALRANRRHWPGMRQTKDLAFLQSAQQESYLDPSFGTERGRLDLASQPNQWVYPPSEPWFLMSNMT